MRLYESISDDKERLQVGLNWHDDPELLYFKSGQFRLTLNLKEYEITDERICLINAGQIRKLEAESRKAVEYAIRIPVSELLFQDSSDPVNEKLLVPLMDGRLLFNTFLTVSDSCFLEVLQVFSESIRHFRRVAAREKTETESSRVFAASSVSDQMYLRGTMLEIISLADAYGMLRLRSGQDVEKQTEAVKAAIRYIRENYMNKIYIHDLSNIAGLNEQYFIRFFGNVTGISPLDYINRYRIKKAAELLRTTDIKVYEVAEMSGFHNVGNFMKIFRSQIGQTPMVYRKSFNQTIADTKNEEPSIVYRKSANHTIVDTKNKEKK